MNETSGYQTRLLKIYRPYSVLELCLFSIFACVCNTFYNVSIDLQVLFHEFSRFPFQVVVDHFFKDCWVMLFPIHLNLV